MARVYLNSGPIPKIVTPAIGNGINKLDKAMSYLNSASAPSGYSNSLYNKKDRINQIRRELVNLRSWLESATRQLDNFESSMEDEARSLPKGEISPRQEIVK